MHECSVATPGSIQKDADVLGLMQAVLARTKIYVALVDSNIPEINLENRLSLRDTPKGAVVQRLILHGLAPYVRQNTRHGTWRCPSLLDFVITRYHGDTRMSNGKA